MHVSVTICYVHWWGCNLRVLTAIKSHSLCVHAKSHDCFIHNTQLGNYKTWTLYWTMDWTIWTGHDYGLTHWLQNNCGTVVENFTLQIQMNQPTAVQPVIHLHNMWIVFSYTCSLAGQPKHTVWSGLASKSQVSGSTMTTPDTSKTRQSSMCIHRLLKC